MSFSMIGLMALASALPAVELRYDVELDVRARIAQVSMVVEQKKPGILQLSFLNEEERFTDFEGEGLKAIEKGTQWSVPKGGGRVSWKVRLEHERSARAYDARATPSWALFRGTDIVPLIRYRQIKGTELAGSVRFQLPGSWSIWGPGGRAKDDQRKPLTDEGFPAPRGWYLAGEVDVVKVDRAGLEVVLVAPKGGEEGLHERATFLSMVLPSFVELTQSKVKRVLAVSAGDPMWRGGLSGDQSFYLHADRPLVSDDKTSPILHELFHVVSRARSRKDGDWIVEGLAEWVTLQTMLATGGIPEEDYPKVIALHAKRGRKAGKLLSGSSSGAKTHRAVVILDALDEWISEQTKGQKGLRDVAQLICSRRDPFDTTAFMALVQEVAGATPIDLFGKFGVLPEKPKTISAEVATSSGAPDEEEVSTQWSHGG